MKFRKAAVKDVKAIHTLVNKFAKQDIMLPRSLNEIYDHLRDYLICMIEEKIIAVCALHVVWEDIAEIRSITVAKKYQKQGIGRRLVEKSLKEAKSLGIEKVFALTYHPEYFKKLGFALIDKNDLPHKIWTDCLKCPKFPDCDEVAVIKRLS